MFIECNLLRHLRLQMDFHTYNIYNVYNKTNISHWHACNMHLRLDKFHIGSVFSTS